MKMSRLILAGLSAAYLLVAASPGAAQVGICSVVTAITSRAEKGTALNIAEFDENVFATRQICDFGLGDWPTAGELLDLNGAIFKPTTVTVFPVSPTTDDYVIVLDDSVAGACDSAAGTATTGCRWTGSAWEAVGDGAVGGGEVNTASNLGGGLANFDSKVSVDLRFNTFSSADFALATNLFTVANDAITNAQAADMATDTLKLRNASGTGDPEDVKISALTEQASPVAGDFLLCETAAGDLRKCDVGDLPAGGSPGFDAITTGTNTAATMTVGTGASIAATGTGAVEATTAEAFAVSGNITMTSTTPTIFLNSSSEDWKFDVLSGVIRIVNTTDVLSRFEIGLAGDTTINPSGSIAGDFTWQSNDNVNAFVCDASADSGAGRCGTGTAAPEHTFDVQATVAGDATLQVKTTSGEATLYVDAGGANNDAEIILQDDDVDRFKLYDDTSLDRLCLESEFATNLFMLCFDHSSGAATFNGNGTATADVQMKGDTEDNVFFMDASTERVGVRTAVPEAPLHVLVAGTPQTMNANTTAVFQGTTDSLVNLFVDGSGSGDTAQLVFGDIGNEFAGRIIYNHGTTNSMRLFVDGAEAFKIESDRNVVMNEAGAPLADVRMESDTNANMFRLDASANQVGIGTATMGVGADLTVNDILHIVPLATAPATCVIGNFYVDTSGAYCGCSVVDTWENMLATGTCA